MMSAFKNRELDKIDSATWTTGFNFKECLLRMFCLVNIYVST